MQNAKKMRNAEEDKLRQRLKKMFENVPPGAGGGGAPTQQKKPKKVAASSSVDSNKRQEEEKTLNGQKHKQPKLETPPPPSPKQKSPSATTTNGKAKSQENVQKPPKKTNQKNKAKQQHQATKENVAVAAAAATTKTNEKQQKNQTTPGQPLRAEANVGGGAEAGAAKKSKKNKKPQNGGANVSNGRAAAGKRAAAAFTPETPQPQKKKPKKQTNFDEEAESAGDDDDQQHLIDFLPGAGAMSGYVAGGDFDETEDEYKLYGGSSDEFDYEEEEEEDEENYSDFDEDDYEEDDNDLYYDSESSDDDEEEDEDGVFSEYDIGTDDDDYQLPEDVPEDLIIHQGTAEKRTLETHDKVQFDSDNEEAQIVELVLEEHTTIKTIKQPKGYEREELLKLSVQDINIKIAAPQKKRTFKELPQKIEKVKDETADSETCPELVPIIDEDGFQLYNPASDFSDTSMDEEEEFDEEGSFEELDYDEDDDDCSLGSSYEECSDADSLNSIDINRKWTSADADMDTSDEEEVARKKTHMKADVITANNCLDESKSKSNMSETQESEPAEAYPIHKIINSVNAAPSKSLVVTALLETGELQDDLEMEINKEYCEEKILEKPQTSLADDDSGESEIETATEPKSFSTTPLDLQPRSTNVFSKDSTQDSIVCSTPLGHSRSICCNAIDSNHVLVLLKDPFYIYGTVKLILIAGSIEVYGHAPRVGDELEIFSPRGCSAVQIKTTPNTNTDKKELATELAALETYFSRAELEKIQKAFVPAVDALLILKRNVARKKIVANFKKYMNENVFPNINSLQSNAERRPFYSSEFLLRCMLNTEDENAKALRIPPQWSTLKLETHSRILLAGGKSVGKSTLLRYLVNRHLPQRILLIDLDIGQPELFVPQTISCTLVDRPLLGPGFFLQRQPDRAYAVGHTNLALCAHAYLRAVKQLLGYCHAHTEYAQLPWLINTMGYNKGFGLELMSLITQLLRPTDIVQLQSNKEINNFDAPLQPLQLATVQRNIYAGEEFAPSADYTPQHRLHVIPSAVPQESRFQRDWDMSAKDMRYAMLLARLSDALQGHAEWLTDCQPLCAPLESLKVVNLLSAENSREELLKSIEANLVYLCHHRSSTDATADLNTPLECFGIGVVRAIDYHVQQIYLLPAMPQRLMRNINCLALGEMPLPTSMFTNQGPKVKQVAPFVYNTVAAKASKSIKQIYHRPPEFLTGKRKDLA